MITEQAFCVARDRQANRLLVVVDEYISTTLPSRYEVVYDDLETTIERWWNEMPRECSDGAFILELDNTGRMVELRSGCDGDHYGSCPSPVLSA